jgi:hypothetical protein
MLAFNPRMVMFNELYQRILFPIFVATLIGSLWVAAWSKSLTDEADKHTWPALPAPHRSVEASAQQSSAQQSSAQPAPELFK